MTIFLPMLGLATLTPKTHSRIKDIAIMGISAHMFLVYVPIAFYLRVD